MIPFPQTETPANLKTALHDLVFNELTKNVDNDQAAILAQASKMDHYWRGEQHLVLDPAAGGFQYVPVGSAQRIKYNRATGSEAERTYDYVMNIYRGDGKKFIGVVGQRSPNVKAVPDRPSDDALVKRAKKGDEIAAIFRKAWKSDKIQRQLAFTAWNFGTAFGYTRVRSDAEAYGITEEPIIGYETQPIGDAGFQCFECGAKTPEGPAVESGLCAQCGAPLSPEAYVPEETAEIPVQTGTEKYANAMVELLLLDCFTVTVPTGTEKIDNDTAWLRYEYDEDQAVLASIYPQLQSKIGKSFGNGAGSDSEAGTLARERAASPVAGYTRDRDTSKWLYTQFWVNPHQFLRVTDESTRQHLQATYPRGVRLVFVQGEFMEAHHEKLSEHWSYCKADVSKSIHSDPIAKDMLPVCDLVNDNTNYNAAAAERINPLVMGDPQVIDFKQYKRRRGVPGDMIPAKAGMGQRLQDAFFKFPVTEMSPELAQFTQALIEQGRENTGILKPIFGGDSGKQTATEAEQNRVQALMQLNIPHEEGRDFWEQTYYNGAVLFARYIVGSVKMPGISLTPEESQDFAELAEGGWHYESEEGMPMTWAQRRALVWSLVDKGPQAWQLFGLIDPDNKQKLLDAVGFPDWTVPMMSDLTKAKKIIGMLLKQQPQMTDQGPLPSIPADEFEDDHAFMRDTVKQWAQSEEGLNAKFNNPAGYANVIAWGRMHHLYIVMAQMGQQRQQQPQIGGGAGPQGRPGLPPPTPGKAAAPADAGIAEPPSDAGLAQQPRPQE